MIETDFKLQNRRDSGLSFSDISFGKDLVIDSIIEFIRLLMKYYREAINYLNGSL